MHHDIRIGALRPSCTLAAAGLAAAALCLAAAPAGAVENGIEASPIGLHAIGAGGLPPRTPLGFLDVRATRYSSSTLADARGDTVPGTQRVTVNALAFKFIGQTDWALLGGRYFWGAALPLLDVNADVTVPGAVVGAPVPFVTLSGRERGLGNLELDPLGVQWLREGLSVTAKLTVGLPTGDYDARRVANPGTGRGFAGPRLGVALDAGSGWKFWQELRVDLNRRNKDTGYRSGNELHLDWAVSKRIAALPALELGVGGYVYRQISDDRSGSPAPAAGRARVQGLGPALSWQDGPDGVWVSANLAAEFGARNRFDGRRFWVRSGIPF